MIIYVGRNSLQETKQAAHQTKLITKRLPEAQSVRPEYSFLHRKATRTHDVITP